MCLQRIPFGLTVRIREEHFFSRKPKNGRKNEATAEKRYIQKRPILSTNRKLPGKRLHFFIAPYKNPHKDDSWKTVNGQSKRNSLLTTLSYLAISPCTVRDSRLLSAHRGFASVCSAPHQVRRKREHEDTRTTRCGMKNVQVCHSLPARRQAQT